MLTQSELETCRKIAAYLKKTALPYLADIYAPKSPEIEAKRAIKTSFFIEFYLVFYPSETKRIDEKLQFAIRQYAAGKLDGKRLKQICDEWIKCHTVAWQDSIPNWKSKEVNKA